MRLSDLFTKTRKDAPKDEISRNASLLIRAGFIHKEMAGVYVYLPLGWRVFKKIENVIREEMNDIGGQELFMSVLQDKAVWEKSGRWSDEVVDDWFKTKLKNDTELGLGFTHEEPLTRMMKDHIASYRDLPAYVYQIQTKFRNELRAKSGIMRGREFVMKDLYSFDRSQAELDMFYDQCTKAYRKIFERCGIGLNTFFTFASGGSFAKFSHEFQTVSEAGEDTIYIDHERNIAVNKEVYTDEVLDELNLKKDRLQEAKAIEVGNIFKLGTRFSESLGLTFTDEDGSLKPVVMGSYGIGVGRLMGTIVEVMADDKGISWPKEVAPAQVHLIRLGNDSDVKTKADALYEQFVSDDLEVLYDDRDESAGTKFADADLIGLPLRVVLSAKTLAKESVEVSRRSSDKVELSKISDIPAAIKKLLN